MSDTPDTTPDDLSPEGQVRSRYEHTCGQSIWVVKLPHGPLYFAELLPTLPPPDHPLSPLRRARDAGGVESTPRET